MNSLEQKAVLVQMTSNNIGTSRKAQKPTQEVEENHRVKNVGAFYKELFNKNAFKELNLAWHKADNVHHRLSLPWISNRIRILPVTLLEQYNDEMAKAKEAYGQAVKDFVENYEATILESMIRLGDLFDPSYYPSKEEAEASFGINVNYFPIPTQEDFRITAPEGMINTLKEKYMKEMATFAGNAKNEIATRLDLALENVIKKLDKTERKVQERLLIKIINVVKELRPLNITGDANLNKIMKEIEDKLGKKSADTLSENSDLRKEKSSEAKDIILKLENSFPEIKGKRSLIF